MPYTEGADFAPHNMTSNSAPSPYQASASTVFNAFVFPAYKGFNGDPATYWLGSNHGVDWLRMDIDPAFPKRLYSYSIRVNNIPEPNRAPKDWTMEGSTDGSTFTTLDTVTGSTGWSSGETRHFVCDSIPAAFHIFRLNVTANNGDADYTQVADMYFYEADGSAGGGIPVIAHHLRQQGIQ